MLNPVELKVIETVVKFPIKELYRKHPTMGVSLFEVLVKVFKHFKWTESPLDVLKGLEDKQYLYNFKFLGLCTCGRHCRWTPREKPQIKALMSKEGTTLNAAKVVIMSGKDLNWTDANQPPIMIAAKPVDYETGKKAFKKKARKPNGMALAKAEHIKLETRITEKVSLMEQIQRLEHRLLEIAGCCAFYWFLLW